MIGRAECQAYVAVSASSRVLLDAAIVCSSVGMGLVVVGMVVDKGHGGGVVDCGGHGSYGKKGRIRVWGQASKTFKLGYVPGIRRGTDAMVRRESHVFAVYERLSLSAPMSSRRYGMGRRWRL